VAHLTRTAVASAALAALLAASAGAYTVAPGDTLTAIAARHGTTVADIVAENDLPDPDRIRAGDRLIVPEPGAAARGEVEDVLERVARDHGWSPAFVKALAWQESGWNPAAVSSAGARGVMQVMPETGRFISTQLVGRDLDLDDVEDNVTAGVVFLQYLWELTDGDPELTLAGYYQGLRSVAEHGTYDDTDRYIANVLALRERFR
jgi:N-acetylmuramoyl-L-alanine amidase